MLRLVFILCISALVVSCTVKEIRSDWNATTPCKESR